VPLQFSVASVLSFSEFNTENGEIYHREHGGFIGESEE